MIFYENSQDSNPVISEVFTSQQLTMQLEPFVLAEVLHHEKVQTGIEKLVEFSHEANSSVYLFHTGEKFWPIVSDSYEILLECLPEIWNISEFQTTINPHQIAGHCIELHRFAAISGVSDGLYERRPPFRQYLKSMYPHGSIHEIGFKNLPRSGNTVFLDLTAKVNVFTDSISNPGNSVLEGLIFIDSLGQTRIAESLYQSKWVVGTFDPEQRGTPAYPSYARLFLS